MQDTAERNEESGFTLMYLVVIPVFEEYNKNMVLLHSFIFVYIFRSILKYLKLFH